MRRTVSAMFQIEMGQVDVSLSSAIIMMDVIWLRRITIIACPFHLYYACPFHFVLKQSGFSLAISRYWVTCSVQERAAELFRQQREIDEQLARLKAEIAALSPEDRKEVAELLQATPLPQVLALPHYVLAYLLWNCLAM